MKLGQKVSVNGDNGEVVSISKARNRIQVRFADGTIQWTAREHVRNPNGAPKAAPPAKRGPKPPDPAVREIVDTFAELRNAVMRMDVSLPTRTDLATMCDARCRIELEKLRASHRE